jgi:hypothetical protein
VYLINEGGLFNKQVMPNTTAAAIIASNSSSLCFLCRFDTGLTIGDMDGGLLGLLGVLVSLCCCCICYTACISFFCSYSTTSPYDLVDNASTD